MDSYNRSWLIMKLIGKDAVVPSSGRNPFNGSGYLQLEIHATWFDDQGNKHHAEVDKDLWDSGKPIVIWND